LQPQAHSPIEYKSTTLPVRESSNCSINQKQLNASQLNSLKQQQYVFTYGTGGQGYIQPRNELAVFSLDPEFIKQWS